LRVCDALMHGKTYTHSIFFLDLHHVPDFFFCMLLVQICGRRRQVFANRVSSSGSQKGTCLVTISHFVENVSQGCKVQCHAILFSLAIISPSDCV
jgi:hypothetical protein